MSYVIRDATQQMTLSCSHFDDRQGRPYALISDPVDPLKFATRQDAANFSLAFLPHIDINIAEFKEQP